MKKRTQVLLLSLILVFVVIIVKAVDFDCRKISTKIEKVIYKDPELSRLNGEMRRLYNRTKHLSGTKWEQQHWIQRCNKICGNNKTCLSVETKERISELKRVLDIHKKNRYGQNTSKNSIIFSPEKGVICDRKSGLCMDESGVSVTFTNMYLGKASAHLLKERISQMKNYNSSCVIFSNGLNCQTKRKTCFRNKHSSIIDQYWTNILFAY